MPYGECKIYSDGSHFIAIPHTTRPAIPRRKPVEEEITVVEMNKTQDQSNTEPSAFSEDGNVPVSLSENISGENTETVKETPQTASEPVKTEKKMTRKALFDKLYAESLNEPKHKRRKIIVSAMRPYFRSDTDTEDFVTVNMERKLRNLIARRIRCVRKANLAQFNYFVTFTYDGSIHTETTFRKQLKACLRNRSNRNGWRYLGVWERSPEKKRLHFHGLFHIPDGTMPGFMFEKNDYNFNARKRQITHQNTYFNERFGRNDFETIDDRTGFTEAVAYVLKYIEKTGEKIVYSKDLPQYFISDIMDDDVVCPIGLEDKKLLLFDDFLCWDEGCLIGKVSAETIKQLRKSN